MNKTTLKRVLGRIESQKASPPGVEPALDVHAHNAQAREILDAFFAQEVVPRLSALHREGRLPDLSKDPGWIEVEHLWDRASIHSDQPCDIEAVKQTMMRAVEAYQTMAPFGKTADHKQNETDQ